MVRALALFTATFARGPIKMASCFSMAFKVSAGQGDNPVGLVSELAFGIEPTGETLVFSAKDSDEVMPPIGVSSATL